MRGIYVSIVLLVLYGDLVKRYLPPGASLIVLYALAGAILLAIVMLSNKHRLSVRLSKEGQAIKFLTFFLIALYLLQMLTSFGSSLADGIMYAIYVSILLLYIVVVQRYCPQFDLAKLGNVFLWAMIPVNGVGLIQNYINPDFFISTAYSESGGIIFRTFMTTQGVFARLPSIFVSSDRYSGMALMQLYFTFVVLTSSGKPSRQRRFWIAFNFCSAFMALFIAGARSRILIAAIVLALIAIPMTFRALFSARQKYLKKTMLMVFPAFAVVLITGYLLIGGGDQDREVVGEVFPVFTLLQQSLAKGDVAERLEEAAILSIMPDEITVFGEGLGTTGGGKPGEFGIRAIWAESGLFWGFLMLLAFAGIVLVLFILTYRAFLSMQPINVAIYCVPLLLIIFALLAGLTVVFELSSAVLLGCTIAVITRSVSHITGPSVGYSGKNI